MKQTERRNLLSLDDGLQHIDLKIDDSNLREPETNWHQLCFRLDQYCTVQAVSLVFGFWSYQILILKDDGRRH
jgi:hypothetical protein